MSFAIITDSTSDISPARAQELGIYVIPLHVIIEGEDLLDQVQITAEEYVARMAGSEQCVSSRGFEQKEHRKLSGLSIGSAHAF